MRLPPVSSMSPLTAVTDRLPPAIKADAVWVTLPVACRVIAAFAWRVEAPKLPMVSEP
jgi:hypothetical protein